MSVITDKILKGENLSEEEIKYIVWDDVEDLTVIDTIAGEEGRWYRFMQTVFSINEELWAVDWDRGLTEMQDNCYMYQPYRVKKQEHIVTVTTYVPIGEVKE